jgi:hypothetical protein
MVRGSVPPYVFLAAKELTGSPIMFSGYAMPRGNRAQSSSQSSFLGWVPTMFVSVPIFGPPLSKHGPSDHQ